ncbi:MAG: hypothetical protein Q8S24_10005 [Eubacteriales bacterium]|nr:hypothetical protein [Eubacteriales bacterium]
MYSPFTLNISPMERLFLINFEKDSDESAGVLRGSYEVSRRGEEVEVTLNPSGGWSHIPRHIF